MSLLDWLLAAFCLATTSIHVLTTAVAMRRCRRSDHASTAMDPPPAVSILRPICGVDSLDHLTLRSSFELDYPNFELIFCCAEARDPAADLVCALMARYPHVEARVLIGRSSETSNPKLNNLLKGWPLARSEWLILADSNVLMPRDYVQRLLTGWREQTGVLCSPPIGDRPAGFWAELECAFLNTYQARWQYTADTFGFGFAQGKTMLWRRRDLARAGGMIGLGTEIAEDAAATKAVHKLGLCARLVDAPFKQPLGRRTAKQVWDRQARWSRLRRMTFPAFFVPEILTGSLFPLLAAAWVANAAELPTAMVVAALALLWFGGEASLALRAGWHVSRLSPLAWAARDALLPALWLQGWLFHRFSWRGNEISADGPALETA